MAITKTQLNKKPSEVAADFISKGLTGETLPPELWLLMKDASQAELLATEFGAPARHLLASDPQIAVVTGGNAYVRFTLADRKSFRELADILTKSVRIACNGFATSAADPDRSYLTQKFSMNGQGMNMGAVTSW